MFIVLLRFSNNKAQAGQYMDAHNQWVRRGFDDGVFLLVGNLLPGLGGAVAAHSTTKDALQARLQDDPFVANDVVSAEIIEIAPSKTDHRLAFVLEGANSVSTS